MGFSCGVWVWGFGQSSSPCRIVTRQVLRLPPRPVQIYATDLVRHRCKAGPPLLPRLININGPVQPPPQTIQWSNPVELERFVEWVMAWATWCFWLHLLFLESSLRYNERVSLLDENR